MPVRQSFALPRCDLDASQSARRTAVQDSIALSHKCRASTAALSSVVFRGLLTPSMWRTLLFV